jgi:hypothetical protein
MRPFLLLTLLTLAPALRATDLTLVRVWPEWRAAESFAGISEFLSGRENTEGQTVLRSQPAERSGYYFLVRTATAAAVPGARVELQVLLPGIEQPRTVILPTDLLAGSHVTLAGLTGQDWPGEKTRPLAWHLALIGPDGKTLASAQSYLWTKTDVGAAAAPTK